MMKATKFLVCCGSTGFYQILPLAELWALLKCCLLSLDFLPTHRQCTRSGCKQSPFSRHLACLSPITEMLWLLEGENAFLNVHLRRKALYPWCAPEYRFFLVLPYECGTIPFLTICDYCGNTNASMDQSKCCKCFHIQPEPCWNWSWAIVWGGRTRGAIYPESPGMTLTCFSLSLL